MPKFRKKTIVIEAHQWFKNGDHPDDNTGRMVADGVYCCEGEVVRYFRGPIPDDHVCPECGQLMHDHGWIDDPEVGSPTVCPSDWIITGVKGEKYPCKADVFAETYDAVDE